MNQQCGPARLGAPPNTEKRSAAASHGELAAKARSNPDMAGNAPAATAEGARIWTGDGVLAHNPVKVSALTG